MLGVSQSGYFAWRGRLACRRQHDDMVLLAHVRSAFALSNGTYGSPRMTRELCDSGLTVGRRRIARLMRDNGLRARHKRRFKRTTDSHHAWPVAPNLLDQDFTATGPDKKWGADISYVWTREGWLYLAVVIDLFARRVVGWATGERLHRDLALSALRKALAMRRPAATSLAMPAAMAAQNRRRSSRPATGGRPGDSNGPLPDRSDRRFRMVIATSFVMVLRRPLESAQYCSIDYQAELNKHGILISMSGKGNCYDNAMVETFFKTLRAELIRGKIYRSKEEAREEIFKYVEVFYNRKRLHSYLGYLTPTEYEELEQRKTA